MRWVWNFFVLFYFVHFCPSHRLTHRPSVLRPSSFVKLPHVLFNPLFIFPTILVLLFLFYLFLLEWKLSPSHRPTFHFCFFLIFYFFKIKKTSLFPSHSSASVFLLLIFFVCFISWCFFFHFLSSFVYSFLCLPSSSASSFLRSFEKIFPPSHCLSFYLKCFYFYFL